MRKMMTSLLILAVLAGACCTGCGAGGDGLGAAFGKAVRSPFSGGDKTVARRKSRDREETRFSEEEGSNYVDSKTADTEHLSSGLAEEREILEQRRKMEEGKLRLYKDKLAALKQKCDELESRHDATIRRLNNTIKVQNMLESDPAVLSRSDLETGATAETEGLGALSEDVLTMKAPSFKTAPAGWKDNPMALEIPEPTMETPTSMQTPAFTQNKMMPKKKDEAMKAAKILAMDGNGADATLILGAGTREGVERGMIFSGGQGKGQTVMVVTKVFPTYSQAMVHPEYAGSALHVRDQVKQLQDLPRP